MNRARTGEYLALGQTPIFHDEPTPIFIAFLIMVLNERFHLRINRRLQHSPGSFSDQLIKRALLIDAGRKGNDARLVHWHFASVCLSLVHGVFLCPLRAVGG